MKPRRSSSIALLFVTMIAFGCAKTRKDEHKSGRLNYVENLKYGPAGVHGQPGWYVTDTHIYVNGWRWSPPIKMDDIARCEPSPNSSVEALKCYSFADMKESAFVLRMKDDKPEWITVSEMPYGSGDNLGEWVGDGHWLLFRDYYFNVTTSERKPIKRLPEDPGKYLRGTSPDLKTIIYEEYCFVGRADLPKDASRDQKIHDQCELSNQHTKKGELAFWLIDAETGAVKILELSKEKYPSLARSDDRSPHDWEQDFQKMLKWEKDQNGRDRLVYPV